MSKKNIAVLEVLLVAALWSIAGIFIKLLPWNSFVIASLRSLLAGSVAFIFLRLRAHRLVFNKRSIAGAAALGITMLLFVSANKYTTAANAIVLQFTSPVFILLISALFLGKKFRGADVLTVILTLAGISLFFFDQLSGGHITGNLMGLGAGLSFACYYITLGESHEGERMSAIVLANALTFLVGAPFIFTTSPDFGGLSILYIVILGVLQLGLPYVLLSVASEHCPPLTCSLLGAAEPLLNPVWVLVFDGEAPGTMSLIGGVVVIATICLWCVYDSRAAKTAAAGSAET